MSRVFGRVAQRTLLLAMLSAAGAFAQQTGALTVYVISGDGAVNQIRRYVPTPTVVEVRDELDRPAAGASVSFALPSYGPSATFAGNNRNWMGTTDAQGRIALPRFAPNLIEGSYEILVTASAASRMGSGVIHETNVREVTQASRRMGAPTKILIVLGAGAAVVAASLLALKSGSAVASAPVPSTSISIVSISVGAPH